MSTETAEKNQAAVTMGRLRGRMLTKEYQSAAGASSWQDVRICGCGCGLTLGRAMWRHPARAFDGGEKPRPDVPKAEKPKRPVKPRSQRNEAAVEMGKLGGSMITSEQARKASRAHWGPPGPRCGCGCGDSLSRAKMRHPARAVMLVEKPEAGA